MELQTQTTIVLLILGAFALGLAVGWRLARDHIEEQARRLRAFYIGKTVFGVSFVSEDVRDEWETDELDQENNHGG